MKSMRPPLGPCFLPPANEVWGKVICLKCVSVHRGVPGPGGHYGRCLVWEVPGLGGAWSWGRVWSRGVWSGEGAWWRHPLRLLLCVVRILLECILVMTYFYRARGPWPPRPLDPLLIFAILGFRQASKQSPVKTTSHRVQPP